MDTLKVTNSPGSRPSGCTSALGVPEDPQHLSTTFPFLLNVDPVLGTKTVFTKIRDHLESSEQWILPFGEKMKKCRLKRL